jgi:hypothetical protein
MWATNGSHHLMQVDYTDEKELKIISTCEVMLNEPVSFVNELEWVKVRLP